MAELADTRYRKRGVKRTALWLALLAAAFYLGFIAIAVWRGTH